MATIPFENRYAKILEKNPREIVLLRGNGCKWRRCRFCDYHTDFSRDDKANYELNKEVLKFITGEFKILEVINSGSFCDLDEETIALIIEICKDKQIETVCFECHWLHRELIADFRKRFAEAGVVVKIKIGVETFDSLFRESYLDKGMGNATTEEIAQYFDQVCLLQGLPGQSKESMLKDIEAGLEYFERICVNIMVPNSKPILPDQQVIKIFKEEIYPIYKYDERVDILLNNTDFGVGI